MLPLGTLCWISGAAQPPEARGMVVTVERYGCSCVSSGRMFIHNFAAVCEVSSRNGKACVSHWHLLIPITPPTPETNTTNEKELQT